MKKTQPSPPTQADNRILSLIEQMMEVVPKGTALGLCDLISAMLSGYFIETGGAVTPAVEAYLRQEVEDEEERAARSRRAAKALTYGSYNLRELIDKLQEIIQEEGDWDAITAQGYRIVPVDFTAYRREAVKKLATKAYFSDANRAVAAVAIGMIAAVGEVNGQRIALLKNVVVADVKVNDNEAHKKELYRQVKASLEADEIGVFDAGFKLVEAAQAGIQQCVIRLALNCTFGKTAGEIPERTAAKGPPPTQYKAAIVRPLERRHGENTIPADPADEICTITDELGQEMEVHIWNKVYFLERHLSKVEASKKDALRQLPIKVMAIHNPAYDKPLLIGTPVLALKPGAGYKIYVTRWPVEGLPQTGKYILSGGGGTHFVHHPTAMQRLPTLSLIFGSLLKYVAATLPPFRTGFWDRKLKPTYGRLLRHLKKVGISLSEQLFKKASATAHLPVGYAAIRLAKA